MTIVAKQAVTDTVDAAIREIVSASHRPEGSYVRLPILYPSGSEVVVRVSGGPDTYFVTDFDVTASIGKRYRRQDEVGTPYCVTIDFDTLEDRQVTVRDRDTMEQERIPTTALVEYLNKRFDR
jgi:threonyl-tRNA synthetase